ncbi:KAP P-loop [Shewanella denitrificans OS217]|uniref:KAP P-loop n=1 Tax=Shewanella denitrificans (strain OS217 / ATCC BAA-1090 / DSM 15013) TaxID=318161 RepID=Q12IN2_SHEDO|nr:P-loop NTPase fold protein [Shewanella denitrificans]ABE56694.1 KAP P-loop [Shewanella denitrificans OS217]
MEKEIPEMFASNYQDWQPIYNWDTCKAGRKEYGKFLCSFLTSSKDDLVVNLNGSWGTGKTELLRRLYVELAERQHPVVYINAWESDFCDDALSVISSEFLNQLEVAFGHNGDPKWLSKFNNLKQKLGKALKFGSLGATMNGEPNAATLLGATSAAVNELPDLASAAVSDNNIRLIEKISSNHANRVQAMKEVREQISALADTMQMVCEAELPIVVLVDELDRCRPTYAIEMLEVIKHFFEARGCVFLVATDTVALEHSIKAVYGASFESEKYLRRFFDRRIALPPLSITQYLKAKALDFTRYQTDQLRLFPFTAINAQLIKIFALLFENAQMSLRDVEQSLQKCVASLEYLQSLGTRPQIVNVIVLMMGSLSSNYRPNRFRIDLQIKYFPMELV